MYNFTSSIDLARELCDTLFGGDSDIKAIQDAIFEAGPDYPVAKKSDEYDRVQRAVWSVITNGAEFPFEAPGPQSLVVIKIEGGDVADMPSSAAIWLDLDNGDGKQWQALCTTAQADAFAGIVGGVEVGRYAWDGHSFGDGHSGCVSSPCPGVIALADAGMPVPTGWVSLDAPFSIVANILAGYPEKEQEAKVQAIALAIKGEDDDARQEYAEELWDTIKLIEAA